MARIIELGMNDSWYDQSAALVGVTGTFLEYGANKDPSWQTGVFFADEPVRLSYGHNMKVFEFFQVHVEE